MTGVSAIFHGVVGIKPGYPFLSPQPITDPSSPAAFAPAVGLKNPLKLPPKKYLTFLGLNL